ncbi:uncharacterized protein [Haliotis cracherodii]|uniref:uncharacterized protein n=1 Tax=Haliotis cracherodii TaxID=6455 RepID=UPI0039EA70B6
MERKLLVVKDLPDCSEDTITNYLEVICDNGVEDIHFYDDRAKHVAMVTMEDDLQDFTSYRRKAKKRSIEGQQVRLVEVSPANGILVKDLPPGITEDTLRFYFETSKAGGADDAVTDSIIFTNLQVATVLFNDTNVVQRVLKKDSHKPQKNSPPVEITPYYEVFHKDVLQYLNSLQPSPASSGYTSPETGSPVTTPTSEQAWSSVISPEAFSNPVSSQADAGSLQEDGLRSPAPVGPWMSLQGPAAEPAPHPPHTDLKHIMESVLPVPPTLQSSDNMTSLTGVPHQSEPPLAALHPYQEERMKSLEDVDEDDLFSVLNREVIAPVQEPARCFEAVLTSAAPPEKPPKPKTKPKVKPKPWQHAAVPEETIKTSVDFPVAHVKLLEVSGVENEFPMCSITYKNGSICMEGPEFKLQEVKLKLYEKNQDICAATHTVPLVIADILKSKKGKSYLDNELKVSGPSQWYVTGTTMHCVAFSESETSAMIEDVKKLIVQETVQFDQSHQHYLKSPEWKARHDSFEEQLMVKVTCNAGQRSLTIDGLSDDVKLVKGELYGELKKHAHSSVNYSLSGAKAKCIKSFYQNDIADIKKKLCDQGGRVDDSGSMSSLTLKMEGPPREVDDKLKKLKQLEGKVWHERLHLGKDVAKEKDLNLLIRGLHGIDPKAMVAAFEAQHPCYLELNLPGKKPASNRSSIIKQEPEAASSRYESHLRRVASVENIDTSEGIPEEIDIFEGLSQSTRRAAPPRSTFQQSSTKTVGNIKISVKKGDLTKEKCDVLVNVVPKTLNLGETAISTSVMRSGGPEFIQQFEMSKLSWSAGGIIQNSACRNLPGKRVFTIVLDKWNPPQSKMDFKSLIDSCLKTADAATYKSIGIAAVGCGRLLKYPEKFVAAATVATITANSSLQNLKYVNLILYDAKTYQTFLDEISPRPRHSLVGHRPQYEEIVESMPVGKSVGKSVTVGGTTITIQQGDITKTRATVLVNVLTADLDLGSTAVSQAFARAGGPSLIDEFESQKAAPARNKVIVTSSGNLPCQYVYHVVLGKYQAHTQKEYESAVRDCFQLANGYNVQSIAFSSLGCGALLKYPPDFVASCLMSQAKKSTVANVKLVIYERSVMHSFLDELTGGDLQEEGSEDISTLRQYAKFSKSGREPSTDTKAANIVVYGANQKTCNSSKTALAKHLKAEYLHSETIENETILKLPKDIFQKMKNIAEKSGIWIKFPDPDKRKKGKPQLKLKGEKNSVLFVKSQVHEILMTAMTRALSKPSHSTTSAKRGTKGFLEHMGTMTQFYPPKYWSHYQPQNTLSSIMTKLAGRLTGHKQMTWQLTPVDRTTYQAIDSLVQKTWDTTHAGHGKDAVGLTHKSIKVKKIERLEHPELFIKYCQKRSTRFMEACKTGGNCPSLPKLPLTTQYAGPELQCEVYSVEVNEHYFFHGTKIDRLSAILSHGLDSRVGNMEAMFGSGIYGAESSTKADQYTDDKTNRTPGDKQMVLMRMTLGHPYLSSKPSKYRRPPCKNKTHLDDRCSDPNHGGFFHSVIGEGTWIFREFVVYEPELCYPEYVITYSRV